MSPTPMGVFRRAYAPNQTFQQVSSNFDRVTKPSCNGSIRITIGDNWISFPLLTLAGYYSCSVAK